MSSRIAVCLYEEWISKFELDQLIVGEKMTPVRLRNQGAELLLLERPSDPGTPEWVDIVRNFAEIDSERHSNSTSGAILFVKLKGRVLACCFGSSVSSINRNNIVTDFGLGVAFFRVQKHNIKTIETFVLSSNPITNNRSAAIPTTQNEFNLDRYLENITELGGFQRMADKSILVRGKEFYSTPCPLSLDKILDLCHGLLRDYKTVVDDEQFKEATATKKVKEKKLIDYLNDELCKKLQKRHSDVYLSDFETFPDIEFYSFTAKGKPYSSVTIEDFYASIPKGNVVTLDFLKYRYIIVKRQDAVLPLNWSLYKCLFVDISLHQESFILYKGHWYLIAKNYLDGLRQFIAEHEINNMEDILPEWDGADDEGDYNIKAAKAIGGQCWDKILYRGAGYNSGIEFCDILTHDFIIHVKKYKNSALNSHLQYQTIVSAQLLNADPGIRKWISSTSRKQFKKNTLLKRNRELANNDIGYLIVLMKEGDKTLAESLPFFSLVSLNITLKQIAQLDFRIQLGKV